MAQERTSRPMAGFFKFTEIGAMAAGKIAAYRTGDNGPFFIIDDAVLRDARKGKPVHYHSAAVALSTDVQQKCGKDDVGKFMLFEFNTTEPTAKGSPRKIFRVLELTSAEFDKLCNSATDKRESPYPRAEKASEPDDNAVGSLDDDDNDELPF